MSTNDAHELERLAALAAARGIATLECPVTGGVHKAAAGEITVIAGGDEAVFAAHRELLEAIGGAVIHVGPLGQASVHQGDHEHARLHPPRRRRRGADAGEARRRSDSRTAYEVIRASSGN